MAKTAGDAYANAAYGSVTMSAANTLTFAQINFGVGLFEGRALVLHRALWVPNAATVRELVAATDSITFALTTSNRLTSIVDVSDPAIVCHRTITCIAANVEPMICPMEQDFSNLPGGGKLLPANPLFVGAVSGGYAAAGVVRVKLEFSFVTLSPADYLEVIQSMFPANVT